MHGSGGSKLIARMLVGFPLVSGVKTCNETERACAAQIPGGSGCGLKTTRTTKRLANAATVAGATENFRQGSGGASVLPRGGSVICDCARTAPVKPLKDLQGDVQRCDGLQREPTAAVVAGGGGNRLAQLVISRADQDCLACGHQDRPAGTHHEERCNGVVLRECRLRRTHGLRRPASKAVAYDSVFRLFRHRNHWYCSAFSLIPSGKGPSLQPQ